MLRRNIRFLGRAATTTSSAAPGPKPKSGSTSSGGNRPIDRAEAMRKLWSPLGPKSSSTPRNVISGSEMQTIFYRRLPPERTVEAEEDVGHNLVLHREFVSKKATREGIPWDVFPEAKSDIEQRKAKASIAAGVNHLRKSIAREANESFSPHLQVSNTIEGQPGSLESVRFVFDDARMKYCDRFQSNYGVEKNVETQIDLSEECKALLEVAAVLYGCESDEGRESWYEFFLGLDRASLEQLEEKRINQTELLESLDEDEDETDEDEVKKLSSSDDGMKDDNEGENSSSSTLLKVKEIPSEFADIYASHQAYCKGQSPTFGNSTLIDSNAEITERSILRKFKYRKLLELLVEEKSLDEYPGGGEEEAVEVAIELNNQLQALKLYGLRVGESVKEALMLMETRGPKGGDASMENKPLDMSPGNPDRRETGRSW